MSEQSDDKSPGKKPEIFAEPSKEFEDAIRRFGSNVVTCDFCNTTYFCTWTENNFEEGELENLRKLAQEKPSQYVEWEDCDGASHGEVDFKTFVIGCPCNRARRYEDWIWAHRFIIADYLEARGRALTIEARLNVEVAEKARAAVDADLKYGN